MPLAMRASLSSCSDLAASYSAFSGKLVSSALASWMRGAASQQDWSHLYRPGLEAHRAPQWRAPLGRGPGCATAGGKQRLCYQEADFRVERSTALDSGFALRSCLVAPRALGLAYVGPSRTSGLVSGR